MSEQQSSDLHDNLEYRSEDRQPLVTTSQCRRALRILESDRQHDFATYYRLSTLRQSIIHRFWLTNSATVEYYLQLLTISATERELLFDLLFPTRGQFFQQPECWKSLATNVIPRLIATLPETELRCWVVGCGTGEAAYTLSILLDEAIATTVPSREVKIVATDVNTSALKIALRGVYPKSIAKDISAARLEKYFTRHNDNYLVNRELRQKIVFTPYNLLQSLEFTDIGLICCCNTLIYLQPHYRQQALSVLHRSLVPQGFLFLGNEESLFDSEREFVALESRRKIFQKRSSEQVLKKQTGIAGNSLAKNINRALPKSDFLRKVFEFSIGGGSGTCLLLDRNFKIVHIYFHTANSLQFPEDVRNRDVIQFVAPELKSIFLQALERVKRDHRLVFYKKIPMTLGDRHYDCELRLDWLTNEAIATEFIIVVLLEKSSSPTAIAKFPPQNTSLKTAIAKLQNLESELDSQPASLQDAFEKLQHQKSDIEAINQEQVTVNQNTAIVNRELYTLNQKYQSQVAQLEKLNQDIENLLYCIDIGVIFLDRQLNVRKYNPSANKIVNFRVSDIGRPFQDLTHNLNANLVEILEEFSHTPRPLQLEVRNLQTEQFLLMKLHSYGSESRSGTGVILTFVDISDRKQAERDLEYQAFYDSLTGLPNRLLFKQQLQHAVNRLPRQNCPFLAVLYLDLNGFKDVNDSLGHSAGDCLLIEVASRLSGIMRSNDIVSRLGGDEFVILLEEIDCLAQSLEISRRIHQALSKPFSIEQQQVKISTSIGIALHSAVDRRQANIETLMENADIAMYRAKQKGAAQTEVFLPQMRSKVEGTVEMKNRLRQALQREEFRLYYQPIFNLQNGKFRGFEALLRWNHPELGLIYPEEFLPTIQKSALFLQLERWILERACSWLRQLPSDLISRDFRLSINVSPQLLANLDFLRHLQEILERTKARSRLLTIELTETALIDNAETVERNLKQLRLRGINIALDDFGTGFSSLSHLHRFPLDIIKIDRSFILSLDDNERSQHIVRSIIYMSQQLNLTTVAEGIESSDRLEWLQSLNCQLGQGYLWSPPLSAASAIKFLAEVASSK